MFQAHQYHCRRMFSLCRKKIRFLKRFYDVVMLYSMATGALSLPSMAWAAEGRSSPFSSILIYAGAALFLVIVAAGWLAWKKFSKRERYRLAPDQPSLETLAEWSPRDFNKLVAEAFRRKGYTVDGREGETPAGRTELIMWNKGRKILVHCRQNRNMPVSIDELRDLRYAARAVVARGAKLVSCGPFGKEAQSYAHKAGIQPVDGDLLLELVRDVQMLTVQAMITSFDPSNSQKIAVESAALPQPYAGPRCPRCHSPMQLKVAEAGRAAGISYWLCERNPDCGGTRPT